MIGLKSWIEMLTIYNHQNQKMVKISESSIFFDFSEFKTSNPTTLHWKFPTYIEKELLGLPGLISLKAARSLISEFDKYNDRRKNANAINATCKCSKTSVNVNSYAK